MKSLSELLRRKKEEPTEPENNEKQEMKLSEISNLDSISEAQLMKLIKQESTSTLTARLDTLIRHSKEMKFLPMETVEEKIQRKNKINKFISIFQTEIHTREQVKTKAQFQQQKISNKETVQRLIRNREIRWTTQDVNLFKRGLISIDVMRWHTATSQIITIGTTKFDLEKIHPNTWKSLTEHKFAPTLIPISGIRTGATREQKEMERWRSGKETYAENKKIKLVNPVYLAIMVV